GEERSEVGDRGRGILRRNRGGTRLVVRPLRPLRRPVLRGGRPLRSDYGRAWPRVRVSAADPREGEGRRDGGRCHDAADGDPWHRLSTGGDRLSHGGATGPDWPSRV